MDVPHAASIYRYYAGWADKNQGKTVEPNGDHFTYIRHEPIGQCVRSARECQIMYDNIIYRFRVGAVFLHDFALSHNLLLIVPRQWKRLEKGFTTTTPDEQTLCTMCKAAQSMIVVPSC